jgi:hypothetical protein
VYATNRDSEILDTIYNCPATYGLLKGVCTDEEFSTAYRAACISELKEQDVLITSSKFFTYAACMGTMYLPT